MNDLLTSQDVPSVDFPGKDRWTTLVTSAVLGVDRQPPAPLIAQHPLAAWVARWADQPAAVRLLREAFVLDRSLLAGQKPTVGEAPEISSNREGHGTPKHPSTDAMQALWQRWKGTKGQQRQEQCIPWIQAAAEMGLNVPDEDLPWVWALGERQAELRPALAAVTSPQGARLLSTSNHPWPFMAPYFSKEIPSVVAQDASRSIDERVVAVQRWIAQEPDVAYATIKTSWINEKAAFKNEVLPLVRAHRAAHHDEAFWTKCLSDRSRNVRAMALNALWGDPATALAQQENTITRACFAPGVDSEGMTLMLPEEGTPADDKRGIDIEPNRRSMGRRAWMLQQRMERTYPDVYATWDGLTWEQRVVWAHQSGEPEALINGWLRAAEVFQHTALAEALMLHVDNASTAHAARVLPIVDRERIALWKLQRSTDVDPGRWLSGWFETWPEKLTQAIVDRFQWSVNAHGHVNHWGHLAGIVAQGHPQVAKKFLGQVQTFLQADPRILRRFDMYSEPEQRWAPLLQERWLLAEAVAGRLRA